MNQEISKVDAMRAMVSFNLVATAPEDVLEALARAFASKHNEHMMGTGGECTNCKAEIAEAEKAIGPGVLAGLTVKLVEAPGGLMVIADHQGPADLVVIALLNLLMKYRLDLGLQLAYITEAAGKVNMEGDIDQEMSRFFDNITKH